MWHFLISISISMLLVLIVIIIFSRFSKPREVFLNDDLEIDIRISDKRKAGIQGEHKAFNELKSLIKNRGHILTNLLVPQQNGVINEIDSVLVSKKGIFCIEIKNWSGKIIGGNTDIYWRQVFNTKRLDKFIKNPVSQNQNHCDILERILNYNYPVDNIVIFINQKRLTCIQSKFTFTLQSFKRCYESLEENQLTSDQVNKIYTDLTPFVGTNKELALYTKRIETINTLGSN